MRSSAKSKELVAYMQVVEMTSLATPIRTPIPWLDWYSGM